MNTMKTLLLIAGILASIAAMQLPLAQSAEGIITYEIKINAHRTLPEDRQAMKRMIPEFRTHRDQLAFNANESLYRPIEEEPDHDVDNGQGVRMRMRRPKMDVYTNLNESIRLMVQEFRGRKYLIEDSLRIRPWKLGSDTRDVNGYLCKQATFHDAERKQTIVVWYSDKLRPFLGPENFNDLPGAVLHVDINDGESIITAKDIVFRHLAKGEMEIPPAKTKVTEPEFRKMVREEMDRRRENGGNMIFRH
jgi:GLPGLI family protein